MCELKDYSPNPSKFIVYSFACFCMANVTCVLNYLSCKTVEFCQSRGLLKTVTRLRSLYIVNPVTFPMQFYSHPKQVICNNNGGHRTSFEGDCMFQNF